MTLQVALVGNDGTVLASDRLLQQWQHEPNESAYSLSMTSKFELGNGIVCCYSGDSVAHLVAINICKLILSEGMDVRSALRDSASESWCQMSQSAPDGIVRKVIVSCPDHSVWIVDVSGSTFVNSVLDRIVAGDIKNTARHIINNYVPFGYAPINLPISRLVFAASHAILMGGVENPTGVGGLEVAVIPKEGPPFFLSTDQEMEIKTRSDKILKEMRDALLEPFNYRPVTPPQA